MSSRLDCTFEIQQHCQSGSNRAYSTCCCSCSFEPEIIKIGHSSLKIYSINKNFITEFSRVYDNFICLYKKVWKLIEVTTYIYIYIYIERERERGERDEYIFIFMVREHVYIYFYI